MLPTGGDNNDEGDDGNSEPQDDEKKQQQNTHGSFFDWAPVITWGCTNAMPVR